MPSKNLLILIGHVGRNPDMKKIQTVRGETTVANFSVATSEWAGAGKEPATEWHSISTFGKTAEYAGKYLAKGSLVYVEGRLRSREYTDKAGIKRKVYEVQADRVMGLSKSAVTEERPTKDAKGADITYAEYDEIGGENMPENIPF